MPLGRIAGPPRHTVSKELCPPEPRQAKALPAANGDPPISNWYNSHSYRRLGPLSGFIHSLEPGPHLRTSMKGSEPIRTRRRASSPTSVSSDPSTGSSSSNQKRRLGL